MVSARRGRNVDVGLAGMTERYSRATAFHEAGHAVVAWSLNLPVVAVRVSDDDASGGTETGPADHLPLIEQIAVRFAGFAAEGVFECPAYELAGTNDLYEISKLLHANGISEEDQGSALRDEGYDLAKTLLENHKSKVIKLANRLVECGNVEASEFLRLMYCRAT